VRDDLWNFSRDDESFRRLISPSSDGGSRRRGIKSGIYLDSLKFCGVVAQVIRRLHSRRIKRRVPARRRECRCPEINRCVQALSISRDRMSQPSAPRLTSSEAETECSGAASSRFSMLDQSSKSKRYHWVSTGTARRVLAMSPNCTSAAGGFPSA